MKKQICALMRVFGAALTVAAVIAVELSPALIMVACEAYFPLEVLPPEMELPPLNTRILQDAKASPGELNGEQVLTLDFGTGAIADLDKMDISLTNADSDCMLSKQGVLAEEPDRPGTYTLKVAALVNADEPRWDQVTVSAGGKKPDGTWLTGSAKVSMEFTPMLQSDYKVFTLLTAHTDGMASPPIADTKLTLILNAKEKEKLPPIQSGNDILISTEAEGMAMNKGAITALGEPIEVQGGWSQTWELPLSQVSKTGLARVEVSVEGYVQANRDYSVQFHGDASVFDIPVENAMSNTGTGTTLNLRFFSQDGDDRDIPRLTLSDIAIRPLTTGGNLTLSNLQHTGIGQYMVDVSWGAPANWSHEAEITITVADTVIAPQTQLVYLSMKKVDPTSIPGFSDGIAMRKVPGGKFKRDSQSNTISELSKAYWLGETEVTNKLWEAVMGYYPETPKGDNYPVGNVSWIEAIVFCNKLSAMTGKTPVYSLNRSYRYGDSVLDLNGQPKEIYDPKPQWEYSVPPKILAEVRWEYDEQEWVVPANTTIDDTFCQTWFGMSLAEVKRRVEKANRAVLFHNGKWGQNPDYDINLDPDRGGDDPWNTSYNGEYWPDTGNYPRGDDGGESNGGGYDYVRDPFGFRKENTDGTMNPSNNPDYDPNNTPYTKHPPIKTADGWLAFRTGTGFPSPNSDWPATDDPDFPDRDNDSVAHGDGLFSWSNEWIYAPPDPRARPLPPGIPVIEYKNDSGVVHHYEVQNISINPNANGYRLPAHQQWIWAAMGADMSPGKLSTVDGLSDVNTQDYLKSFAGYNGSNNVADYVWFNDTAAGLPGSKPVQGKKPNELGLWDMSGNMDEWCYDQAAPESALISFPSPGSPNFWVPKPMRDNDHYFADIKKVLVGGSYCSPISELTFGYVPGFIRPMDQKNRSDQGLRVMRWVQPGE